MDPRAVRYPLGVSEEETGHRCAHVAAAEEADADRRPADSTGAIGAVVGVGMRVRPGTRPGVANRVSGVRRPGPGAGSRLHP